MPKKKGNANMALVASTEEYLKEEDQIPAGYGMSDQMLEQIVNDRQGANAIIKELQTQVDAANEQIKAELAVRGVSKLTVGNWIPQVTESVRTTLNKAKLLSAGVTVAQIEAASERTDVVTLRVLPVPMEK